MSGNLDNLRNTKICKNIMAMTMRTNNMAIGTSMAMHQEKEIMEVKQNLNKNSMKKLLILLQARPCRS
eukprot:991888-Prorocentrum_lima.AAC.1